MILFKENSAEVLKLNKISMYQITEELINEGSLIADLELVTTNDVNSNTCKAFANIMNDLGIDEGLFKENDKNYNFNEISKEAVKNIIKKNKIFRTEIKKVLGKTM